MIFMTRKKKIIIGSTVGVLVIIGLVAAFGRGNKSTLEYTTAVAAKQNLNQTVSATGKIQTAEEIELNFQTSGRIVAISTKVGAIVKAGTVLARLDAGDLSAQLSQYQAAVNSAQANLDKLLAGSSTETVAVSQQEVASAQAAYQAALIELENAKKNKDKNLALYRDTALADLDNYLFKTQIALNDMQEVFDDVNGDGNLSVKNPQYLVTAKTQKSAGSNALVIAQSKAALARQSQTDNDITTALLATTEALRTTLSGLDATYNALVASIDDAGFTTDDIAAYKTTIKADQTTLSTGVSTLQADKSNLDTKDLAYANAIDTAQSNANSAKLAWELAQARLDLTKADPTSADIAYQQALVDQARGQLRSIQARLSDRIIKAPVDGTITAINNSVGETFSLSGPILVMLPDQDFEIEVDIPESDIAKISVNDPVVFTLDAFREDQKFDGTVTLIDPAQTEIQGVVYYKVTVSLAATTEPIKPGMTANVDILTDSRTDVIVIPTRAVKEIDGRQTVQVMVDAANQTTVEREVTVGLRGDDGLSEIISGLTVGEEVVTFVKDNSKK